MPKVAKKGNIDSGGGVCPLGDPTVRINGRDAGRVGDYVTGHPFLHPFNPIIVGSNSILVGGRKLGFLGSLNACGHVMVPVETDVIVGL